MNTTAYSRAAEEATEWVEHLAKLQESWRLIAPPTPQGASPAWPDQLARMATRMQTLQQQGRWDKGPHDLLSIVGLNRWELAHSAALAWLCTPHAAHGLGAAFLEALIAETGEPVSMAGPIECRTEVSRAESRADVIVQGAGWTVVVEVKVDAFEQPEQARRLFDDWSDEGEVRFIFLTRHSMPPKTASPESQSEWTPLSWRKVRELLRVLIAFGEESAHAHQALLEYQRTLEATF